MPGRRVAQSGWPVEFVRLIHASVVVAEIPEFRRQIMGGLLTGRTAILIITNKTVEYALINFLTEVCI